MFPANIAAIAAFAPALAKALLETRPREDVEFYTTEEGVLSASIGAGSVSRLLASRRRPLEEGRRLAETVDLTQAAGVLVLGFGAGHHARMLVERLPRASAAQGDLPPWGVVVIYEPDLPLLRAVLERIDHSGWLRRGDVVFVTEPTQAAIASAMRRREALPFLGTDVAFLDHPAQRWRLGSGSAEFVAAFRSWIARSRTEVMTTLANCHVFTRNALMNLDHYVTSAGVADLGGAAAGRPAIVVAAGPSLRRNMRLLKDPAVRERFVIIAVQTVLRPLLAEGIRPHFVSALDYHEISTRFYEGLTAADVEGITLIADAKANPAILGIYPGAIRLLADGYLEEVLGDGLSRVLGVLRWPGRPDARGATVAHMAYYVARHMGCDPVVLVGQDLGFTDGQYYAPGASIHRVWGSELSEFRTLEMFEWERIARGRFTIRSGAAADGTELPTEHNLQQRTDVFGRSIYVDQQMATYLAQFEQDFRDDQSRGLRVIDATEGGVSKRHTTAMTLAEALRRFAGDRVQVPAPVPAHDGAARKPRVTDRVRSLRQDVWRIGEHSRAAEAIIREMLDHQHDQARVNRLIVRAHTLGEEVSGLKPAFALVQFLNQAGSLKRVRADREIMLTPNLSPMERQRRELERDLTNVRWLADAADELGANLDATARMLGGGARVTSDAVSRGPRDVERVLGGDAPAGRTTAAVRGERARIAAMICVDPERSGLGLARDLATPLGPDGRNALRRVVERLARCRELDAILLVCRAGSEARVRALVGDTPGSLTLDVVGIDGDVYGGRADAMRGARLWSPAAWRGGLGGLTVYDEACPAVVLAPLMEARGIDAAAVVGADWALIDPALVDAAAARFREGGGDVRLAFCQAPAGLGTAVVERTMMREFATTGRTLGPLASIGGRIGYSPLFAMPDPIANLRAEARGRPVCVTTPADVRDCGVRWAADTKAGRELISRAVESLAEGWAGAGCERIVGRVEPTSHPREFVIELCTGRLTSGPRGEWLRGGATGEAAERPVMSAVEADRILRRIGALGDGAAVTFHGAGDPLLHPELPAIIDAARKAGIAGVHVRTDLVSDRRAIDALLDASPDVLSVDLCAETTHTYRALMGADLFDRARDNLVHVLERRGGVGGPGADAPGLPTCWVVPRITRCDATYEEIEPFYDRWLLGAGAAAIDAMPAAAPGERIEPLPLPGPVAGRVARERMVIRSDGSVVAGSALDFTASRAIGHAGREDLLGLWKKSLAAAATAEARAAISTGGAAREVEGALA